MVTKARVIDHFVGSEVNLLIAQHRSNRTRCTFISV